METVSLGRYRIVREIARGAMGIVFEAEDPALGRPVALKVLKEGDADERLVKRLHREALAAAKLRHPNIITIHDVGTAGPVHYFAMDFVDGRPLDRVLADGDVPLRDLVRILEDVARAVHHAHENGIIHRDLKPANILVGRDGRPVVTDFGLAKEIDGPGGITRSGAAVGTPHFMAPEQVRAESAKIGPRTDVFALGVVLYEMLAGRLPFEGPSIATVFQAILTDDPVPPSRLRAVDAEIETVCLRALEKHPEFRYRTAADLADDLRRWRNREPVTARAVPTIRRLRRRLGRHPVAVAAVVAVLAVLAAGFPVAWWQWRERGLAAERAQAFRDRDLRRLRATPEVESGVRRYESALSMSRSVPKLAELLPAIDEAEGSLRRALAIDPDHPEAHAWLGRVLALRYAVEPREAAFAEADLHLRRAAELNPLLLSAHLARGHLQLDRYLALRGAPVLALSGGVRAEPPPPESPAARQCREHAVRAFQAADHPATPRADLAYAHGRLAHAEANFEVAAAYFEEAVRHEASREEAWYHLGFARLCLGRLEEAVRAFDEALRWRANYPLAWAHRGLGRCALRRYDQALEDLTLAHRALGDEPFLLIARALCHRRRTPPQLDVAEHDLTTVLRSHPHNATARLNRGEVRLQRGHLDGAITDLTEAVRLAPSNPSAHLNLGAAYLIAKRYDEAIPCFDRAIELAPRHAAAFVNRARARAGKSEFERAIADLTKAIELEPGEAETWNLRGTLREENDPSGALADYDRAIALAPKFGLAWYNRGLLRAARGLRREGLEDLRTARELAPELREEIDRRIAELQN